MTAKVSQGPASKIPEIPPGYRRISLVIRTESRRTYPKVPILKANWDGGGFRGNACEFGNPPGGRNPGMNFTHFAYGSIPQIFHSFPHSIFTVALVPQLRGQTSLLGYLF